MTGAEHLGVEFGHAAQRVLVSAVVKQEARPAKFEPRSGEERATLGPAEGKVDGRVAGGAQYVERADAITLVDETVNIIRRVPREKRDNCAAERGGACVTPEGKYKGCRGSRPKCYPAMRAAGGATLSPLAVSARQDRFNHSGARTSQGRTSLLPGKQLPVPLGDDLDRAIAHFYGRLIVNRVPGHRQAGGPSFCVGHGIVRQIGMIQVRKYRKVHHAQRLMATGGRSEAPGEAGAAAR